MHTTSPTITLLIPTLLFLPAIPSTCIECLLIAYFHSHFFFFPPDYLFCKCNSRFILFMKPPMTAVCINHQATTICRTTMIMMQQQPEGKLALGMELAVWRGIPRKMNLTEQYVVNTTKFSSEVFLKAYLFCFANFIVTTLEAGTRPFVLSLPLGLKLTVVTPNLTNIYWLIDLSTQASKYGCVHLLPKNFWQYFLDFRVVEKSITL